MKKFFYLFVLVGLGTLIGCGNASRIDKNSIVISLEDNGKAIEVNYGEEFDWSLISISYKFKKQNSDVFTIKKENIHDYVSGFDNTILGEQEITISFEGVSKSFYVNVIPNILETPTVKYNSTLDEIYWSKIDNATSYTIYYSRTQGEFTKLATVEDELSFSITSTYGYGDNYYCVKANSTKIGYNESEKSNSLNIYKLARPSEINFYNGILSWNPVVGADEYIVYLNNKEYGVTSSNLINFELVEGKNTIKVVCRSNKNEFIETESLETEFTKFEKINGIKCEGNILSFDPIDGVEAYEIYGLGREKVVTKDNKLDLSSYEGSFKSLYIVAIGDKKQTYDSDRVDFEIGYNLDLKINNGNLSWNNLGKNYSYKLIIDNIETTDIIEESTFDLTSYPLTPGKHNIQIKVEGLNNNILNTSLPIEINKLDKPKISFDGTKINVDNANYKVIYYLDDEEFNGEIDDLLSPGPHVVKARYLNEGNNICSDYSRDLSLVKFSTPYILIEYGRVKCINATKEISYYLNGVEFDGDLLKLTPGTYEIYAKCIGDNNFTISSNDSNKLIVTKYSEPSLSIKNGEIVVDNGNLVTDVKYYADNIEFDGVLSKLEPGTHNIEVKYVSSVDSSLDSNYASISFKKYEKPIIIVVGKEAFVDHMSYEYKLYLNDIEFDGDLSSIEPGEYNLKAKYFSTNDNEMDSEFASVSIKVLENINIKLVNNKIEVENASGKYSLFVNGEMFDGDLDSLDAGEYQITGKYTSDNMFVISSNSSNVINITKLEKPILSLEGKEIVVSNASDSIKYYLDNVEFDGKYSSIPSGKHIITAKNIGNNIDIIDSKISDELTVIVMDITVQINMSTSNRAILSIDQFDQLSSYDLVIDFYDGDNKIDSISYDNRTTKTQTISLSRNGVVANKLVIKVIYRVLEEPDVSQYVTIIKELN